MIGIRVDFKRPTIISLLIITIIAVYLGYLFSPRNFSRFNSDSNITRLFIFHGSTGENYSTTEKEDINEFITIMNDVRLKLRIDQWNITMGYGYYVDLFDGDKKIMRIMFKGRTVYIDHLMYHMDKDVSVQVKDFFNKSKTKST